MIRNGPNTRLSSAPGRRTTSRTSLPMKEVVRVQRLSSPSIGYVHRVLIGRDQAREHLVEGWSIFAAGLDLHVQVADGLDHARRCRTGVVDDQHQAARRVLLHAPNAFDM